MQKKNNFNGFNKSKSSNTTYDKNIMLNSKIPFDSLFVIDENAVKLGEMSTVDALNLAKSKELDVFVVSKDSTPPIAKILDYNRVIFEKKKRQKLSHKKTKKQELKDINFMINIDKNDYETKMKKSRKFLEEKNKVRFAVKLRGREISSCQGVAKDLFDKIINDLNDVGSPDSLNIFNPSEPKNLYQMIFSPKIRKII